VAEADGGEVAEWEEAWDGVAAVARGWEEVWVEAGVAAGEWEEA
jgi:hypothetical protein